MCGVDVEVDKVMTGMRGGTRSASPSESHSEPKRTDHGEPRVHPPTGGYQTLSDLLTRAAANNGKISTPL